MKWFNRLTAQELKLIKVGAVVIFLALSWAFVYKPVTKSIEEKIRQKNYLQQQYSQMQSSKSTFLQKQKNAVNFRRDANKPFITWIDEQLASRSLTQFVTRSEPKDSQTVTINFESINFDDLASWLQPLELNYGVHISEADINLTDRSNGLCNARITLEENQ